MKCSCQVGAFISIGDIGDIGEKRGHHEADVRHVIEEM
jgi:hypothetical protein